MGVGSLGDFDIGFKFWRAYSAIDMWRDPRVWKALKLAEPDKDCRWGHATWSPKKSWPKLA